MVIKLKDNVSDNDKAPTLKGFLVVTPTKLKEMLSYVEEQQSQVVYVDVALWPARDAKYRYEGKTSLREQFDSQPTQKQVDEARLPFPADFRF